MIMGVKSAIRTDNRYNRSVNQRSSQAGILLDICLFLFRRVLVFLCSLSTRLSGDLRSVLLL